MHKHTALATLAFATLALAGPAFAQQSIKATVYRTTPTGVYIQTREGITFVPNQSADFRLGNTLVNTANLLTGKPYQIRYDEGYQPTYIPQQYYQTHKDWDWDRYQKGWKSERKVWVQDKNGNWTKRRPNNNRSNNR